MFENVKELLQTRRQSYRQVFNGIQAETVLSDLAKFCRADKSAFHKDERATLIMLGRQEVWLRIQQHLNMTDKELWTIFMKDTPYDD